MSFLRSLRIPLSNAARGPASVASYARRMLSSSTVSPSEHVFFDDITRRTWILLYLPLLKEHHDLTRQRCCCRRDR